MSYDYDFNQNVPLMMVCLPEKTALIAKEISLATGYDIATVLANSLVFMAQNTLSEAKLKELSEALR